MWEFSRHTSSESLFQALSDSACWTILKWFKTGVLGQKPVFSCKNHIKQEKSNTFHTSSNSKNKNIGMYSVLCTLFDDISIKFEILIFLWIFG